MANTIHHYLENGKQQFEKQLELLFLTEDIPSVLKESMSYSLLAGGKRLRPILMMASYQAFQPDAKKTLKSAIALEMIHTYSLIHDDLPAMDDDDIRRGAPTNHKKFDEATAILAGDALLTYSFELIAKDELLTDTEKVYIIQHLTQASGPEEMIAGQMLDMEGENRTLTLEELESIHIRKTGALITFAIKAGAYLAKASKEQIKYLEKFAYYLGLIFQVQDDILDIIGDPEKLGKPVGSDTSNEKSTYPSLLGLEGAKSIKKEYIDEAEKALMQSNTNSTYLLELLYYFSNRDH